MTVGVYILTEWQYKNQVKVIFGAENTEKPFK